MKKVVSFLVLFVVVAMIATSVSAVTSNDFLAKAKELANKYNVPETVYKASLTRYVENNNNLTEAKLQNAISKIEETGATLDKLGVKDYTEIAKLSEKDRNEVISKATAAASAIDAKLVVTSGNVKVTDPDGKTLINASVNPTTGKITKTLAYTGNDSNVVLVVSSVVAIALVAGVVARKKFANA